MLSNAPFQYITLEHGGIEIGSKPGRNAFLKILANRKSMLFNDRAQASATVYSVMETAKANGLNPAKYISHLLSVLPERFAKYPKTCCRGQMS